MFPTPIDYVASWLGTLTHNAFSKYMICKAESMQSCQPPIFGPDIWAKSESNHKCLRKSLHKTNPKSTYWRQNAIHGKTRVNGTM